MSIKSYQGPIDSPSIRDVISRKVSAHRDMRSGEGGRCDVVGRARITHFRPENRAGVQACHSRYDVIPQPGPDQTNIDVHSGLMRTVVRGVAAHSAAKIID